jgi:hypothetical protein
MVGCLGNCRHRLMGDGGALKSESRMMIGIVIKPPWIELILAGEKTWEIRGSRTAQRGRVALIKSGSGMIFGTVDLTECLGPLTREQMLGNLESIASRQKYWPVKCPIHGRMHGSWATRSRRARRSPTAIRRAPSFGSGSRRRTSGGRFVRSRSHREQRRSLPRYPGAVLYCGFFSTPVACAPQVFRF